MGSGSGVDGRIGVAVVGLGRIAEVHLDAVATHPAARLVAVCDTHEPTATEVGRRLGVRAVMDHRALLDDPAVDAVLLLLPHELHHPVAMAALRAGRHVILEKPFAVSTAQCLELVDAARATGRTLGVTHNTRFVEAYLEAARLVRAGELGEVQLVRAYNAGSELETYRSTDPRDSWRRERNGIGALLDVSVHYFYLLAWLLGEIDAVRAVTRNAFPGIAVEDHCLVSGTSRSGTAFTVETTLTAQLPWQERLEIHGTTGAILIDQRRDPPAVLHRGPGDRTGSPLAGVPFDPTGWRARSIVASVHDVLDAIVAGGPVTVDLAHATTAVAMVERAETSAAAGGVRIPV